MFFRAPANQSRLTRGQNFCLRRAAALSGALQPFRPSLDRVVGFLSPGKPGRGSGRVKSPNGLELEYCDAF
jgi:hypothetical protein